MQCSGLGLGILGGCPASSLQPVVQCSKWVGLVLPFTSVASSLVVSSVEVISAAVGAEVGSFLSVTSSFSVSAVSNAEGALV